MTASRNIIQRDRIPGDAVYALFIEDDGREVPWQYQVFAIAPGGARTPIDFVRDLRRCPDSMQLSAELLGVEPGTPFEVDVLAGGSPPSPRRRDGLRVVRTFHVTAERLGVMSSDDLADLPVESEVQSITDRGPYGRLRRTADGWVCDAAPTGGDPSWHAVGQGAELRWRLV
jgi:hypothetical protein